MMRKEEYNAWRTMPITQEFFALIQKQLNEENLTVLHGEKACQSSDDAAYYYYTTVAVNKFFDGMKNARYDDLIGAPAEAESIMENENDGNEESKATRR